MELAGKSAAPFSRKRAKEIFQRIDVKKDDKKQNGIQSECGAVLQGISAEEFVVGVPEQGEKAEANRKRNESADGDPELAKVPGDLQGNDEKGESEAEDYVAEDFDARDRCAAQAEASFRVALRIVKGHG